MVNRTPYNKADWYWVVAGDGTRVWSSKAAEYVLVGNTTYQAWHTKGGMATRIGSESELSEVLGELWPGYVPPIVLAWKCRAALKLAGKFEVAEQAVAGSDSIPVKEAFEYATEWHRASPAVNAMAGAIGMTSGDVDSLFRTANSIVV